MKKFDITPTKKHHTIQILTDRIADAVPDAVAVYVHGSFNEDGPFADIDLGVLTHGHAIDVLAFEIDLEQRLGDAVGFPVDVRVLDRAPLSFVQGVLRHGRLIVDRDPDKRADFTGRILKQYFATASNYEKNNHLGRN